MLAESEHIPSGLALQVFFKPPSSLSFGFCDVSGLCETLRKKLTRSTFVLESFAVSVIFRSVYNVSYGHPQQALKLEALVAKDARDD